MPLNKEIKKVLVIGSGPIIIGQAAEFDYAGTQACRALKEEGLEVCLVNSNPATIMTDNLMADQIYIEPLTLKTVKRIIKKEKPDSILSTLGGQTGLTISMQLAKEGFLDKHNVKLLGAKPETIDRAEDRQLFKDTLNKINQPCIPSKVVETLEDALEFVKEIGYPVIIRPAFTMGGTGGGICSNEDELREIASNGLRLSPITQILVEKCISGWKEIEFEVIRDAKGNLITVCSMENFDPVGVHTGDSIVVAPSVTLSNKEYNMLRTAALNIVDELGVEGGCNCQFALEPNSFDYAVIEVNPRVSRSSALASKATGYPIAKVATKIAIGYTLDEIKNAVTGTTYACFEPALDYLVVKMPKWPFDKFVYAKRLLGTQMKATGEVMSIGHNFEEAIMKAIRGAEIGLTSLNMPKLKKLQNSEIESKLSVCDDERLFVVFEAIKRGISIETIFDITKIDRWFLNKLNNLVTIENELSKGDISDEYYLFAKKNGYPDNVIKQFTKQEIKNPLLPSYKMVDTCAAEFEAKTPYFYSSYEKQNEAKEFLDAHPTEKETIIVFGSGPIRIGQGIEFDYASVHCVWALKNAGYEVVIVNNNPETVSTDFDTADRLYFEPLTPEDVWGIIQTEKPVGVVVAFGGQTAIKLTNFLSKMGMNILGTGAEAIDKAEDREKFDELLEKLQIRRPQGYTVMNTVDALKVANKIEYPVLMRPSYVLGGQNMIIAFNDEDIKEYMEVILAQNITNPILIDKYLSGTEIEIDAICDGEEILIPGIMEHIERAGIHSGDSIAVYPAWNLTEKMTDKIISSSKSLALSLNTKGLINIQYLVYQNNLYVIEVNPRSSRTIPYISKVTGVPMVELATRAMLGEKLTDMGYGIGLYPKSPYVAVKVPVFSFEKLINVDNHLGPEMKSTGEVLGIADTMEEALLKGLTGAGYTLEKKGGVFITVRNSDKSEIGDTAKKFAELGFKIYATKGTARVILKYGVDVIAVDKIHENPMHNTIELIESGEISYVISTSSKGRIPTRDSVKIRRKTVERNIPCLTSIDTANAVANSLKSCYTQENTELVNINNMRKEKDKKKFVKMQGSGNDYIVFDCFEQNLSNPMGLAIRLADRNVGIGAEGIVLISKSEIADAKMNIYNIDGTEGKMAGNAIRCVGKYIYENNIAVKNEITIETLSGIKKLKPYLRDGKVNAMRVDMGAPKLAPSEIPIKLQGEKITNYSLQAVDEFFDITCVNMGNPHAVIFVEQVDIFDVAKYGPSIEHNELFPDRTNTEFVTVVDRNTLKMRVWERGNGETTACGTGACAAVVAAIENGYCEKNKDITVRVKGGNLIVRCTDDTVYLTGTAIQVYEGVIEL